MKVLAGLYGFYGGIGASLFYGGAYGFYLFSYNHFYFF